MSLNTSTVNKSISFTTFSANYLQGNILIDLIKTVVLCGVHVQSNNLDRNKKVIILTWRISLILIVSEYQWCNNSGISHNKGARSIYIPTNLKHVKTSRMYFFCKLEKDLRNIAQVDEGLLLNDDLWRTHLVIK